MLFIHSSAFKWFIKGYYMVKLRFVWLACNISLILLCYVLVTGVENRVIYSIAEECRSSSYQRSFMTWVMNWLEIELEQIRLHKSYILFFVFYFFHPLPHPSSPTLSTSSTLGVTVFTDFLEQNHIPLVSVRKPSIVSTSPQQHWVKPEWN